MILRCLVFVLRSILPTNTHSEEETREETTLSKAAGQHATCLMYECERSVWLTEHKAGSLSHGFS